MRSKALLTLSGHGGMLSLAMPLSAAEERGVRARTLLVRATEPMGQRLPQDQGEDWRPAWAHPHDVVDVPGDHFSMMESYAEGTASVSEAWISAVAGEAAAPRRRASAGRG